jgi:hypothetical protein
VRPCRDSLAHRDRGEGGEVTWEGGRDEQVAV